MLKRELPTKHRPAIVGVIASPADLRLALRMEQPPDLFELRLDHLRGTIEELEQKMPILSSKGGTRHGKPTAFIITARDPHEGGANNLSFKQRVELLLRFLPLARYMDVELRSARAFHEILATAKRRKVGCILSFHNFKGTPSASGLVAKLRQAKVLGADIFKIATRTDTVSQLARLLDFVSNTRTSPAISAMGMGRLGGLSRLLLTRCGSVLNYAALGPARIEGQLPLEILRSALPR